MMLSNKKNAWYFIAERLLQHGIKNLFGMVGDGVGLLEASQHFPEMKVLTSRDQRSAIAMAMGYSQVTKSCAVYSTSSGPGVVNSLLGILEAESGCLPLIIFSNGVARNAKGRGAFQELDVISLLKPLTKWCYRVEDHERLLWTVDRGIHLAINGKPRPVYIEIPNDLIDGFSQNHETIPNIEKHLIVPSIDKIEKAAEIINKSNNIIIILGGGCRYSQSDEVVEKFISTINAAVFSTASGRNIYPESEQLSCGLMGLYLSHPAENLFATTDLIIVLGSQLEETSLIGLAEFFTTKPVIQVDICYESINKSIFATHSLIGDITSTLEAMMKYIKRDRNNVEWFKLINSVKESQKKLLVENIEQYPVRSLYHALSNLQENKKTVFLENGLNDIWGYSYPLLQFMRDDICITPAEQTGLGLAFGQAVGAKFAYKDRETIVIAGDGAFTLGRNALFSAAENELGIICIVINSGGFSWSAVMQEHNNSNIGCEFKFQEDLAAFCKSLNAYYFSPRTFLEITHALNEAKKYTLQNKLVLIEIATTIHDIPYNIKKYFLGEASE